MKVLPDFSFARAVTTLVKISGGLSKAVAKPFKLYQREGLSGIKRGLRILAELGSVDFYGIWCGKYDTLDDQGRAMLRASLATFSRTPVISIVMPTYNPKLKWLAEAIDSVRQQIYPFWELCIADDASTDPAVRSLLEKYASEDPRIKVVFRETNGHISASSNTALNVATGEWTALLDHDDVLAEHALYWVAEAFNRKTDLQLIYSDEDKIDEKGWRHGHYFKSDWNIDLFYSHNMINHLGVYRIALLKEIGGFRVGMEGSQDYDLALRFIEQIEPQQIYHIPRVLYHWRTHSESVASSNSAKPYAVLAGERALNEHFERSKIDGKVVLLPEGYRLVYTPPEKYPMVTLVMPTRNHVNVLRRCVESILGMTEYPSFELLIIDNGSDDRATIDYLNQIVENPAVRIIHDARPFNYSALNNEAVRAANGDLIALVNNDLEVISPDWLSEMVRIALQPGVGAVGAKLWYPDNTLQHGGVILGVGGVASHSHKFLSKINGYAGRAKLMQSFSAVTAACLVIKKSIYDEVGGLNENDLPVAFNDVDFCLRIREAGYRNVWTPYAELYHHESASRGQEDTPEKQARFTAEVQYMKKRWGDILLNDPAYNPNLTLEFDDFSLAFPPRVKSIGVHGGQ